MKPFDLLGKKFGKWTVLSKLGRSKTSRDILWLCRCECGKERPVKTYHLTKGYSSQCVDCGHLPTKYSEELPDCIWNKIVLLARRRRIKVVITKHQAYQTFLKQKKLCALTKLPICFPKNGTEERHRSYTASLDRIDSKKGYTLNNIQWVHKHINVMKNVFTQSYFIELCHRVSSNLYVAG